jgi:hypothetical protein
VCNLHSCALGSVDGWRIRRATPKSLEHRIAIRELSGSGSCAGSPTVAITRFGKLRARTVHIKHLSSNCGFKPPHPPAKSLKSTTLCMYDFQIVRSLMPPYLFQSGTDQSQRGRQSQLSTKGLIGWSGLRSPSRQKEVIWLLYLTDGYPYRMSCSGGIGLFSPLSRSLVLAFPLFPLLYSTLIPLYSLHLNKGLIVCTRISLELP